MSVTWNASLVLGLLVASSGCQKPRGEYRVTSYLQDGALNTKAIVADVERPLQDLSRGIEENDADLIFGIFSNEKPTTYVRDGVIEESIEQARKSYARSLAKLQRKRRFSFKSREFDVLSERLVHFTGIGVVESPGQAPWNIAYTILFDLEDEGWKAVNMHISWENSKK